MQFYITIPTCVCFWGGPRMVQSLQMQKYDDEYDDVGVLFFDVESA